MISVITPCKNIFSEGRDVFFKKMIETLHTQTYQDFEHLVMDGGSEDGSLEMLEQYTAEGKIDTLVSKKDKNVHEAINNGLKLAKGEIIHVMNSDNYFARDNFFEMSLAALEKYGVDYTHGDRDIIRRDGGPTTIKKGDEKVAFYRMPFRWQTMLIRREIYDEFGPFDEKYTIASDYKFFMNVILAGKKGHYFPEVLIHSLSGGITADRERCINEVTEVLHDCYGRQYGLSLDECRSIYLRQISSELIAKISESVLDQRILASLSRCYYQQAYATE